MNNIIKPISPIIGVNDSDSLDTKQRIINNRNRRHMTQESMSANKELEDNNSNNQETFNYDVGLFNEGVNKFDKNSNKLNKLNNTLETNPNKIIKDIYKTKFLNETEFNVLLEAFEDHELLKDKFNELHEAIENTSDNDETQILNQFFIKNKLNKAQMYMSLQYIFNKLQRKNYKKSLQKKLSKWLSQFETQESGYLFEFFSINNCKVSNKFSTAQLDTIAKVNSGNININNLKELAITIDNVLNGSFDNSVSIFIKLRAHQLQYTNNMNFEDKAKFVEIYKLERNLIILNSTHNKLKLLKEKLSKNKIEIRSSNLGTIMATLNLIESNFISEISLNNLINAWQIKINNNSFLFLNYLISLINKLPIELFNNNKNTIKKLNDNLRTILKIRSNKENDLDEHTELIFLKKRKYNNLKI